MSIYSKVYMNSSITVFSPFLENLTEIATICTESGIWQPISFNCVFDPLAINLKKSGSIGGMYMSH